MRKLTLIFLAVIYIIPVIGVSVNAHFCRGNLSSVSLFSSQDNSCTCISTKPKKNCCDDKILSIKIKETPQVTSTLNFEAKIFQPFISIFVWNDYQLPSYSKSVSYNFYHPPGPITEQLFIRNRILII